MSAPEVVIVGAGAAGTGAGIELAARGIPFVILEAADRIGGRAFTDKTSLPAVWDQGCSWFHCADVNPLVAWADRLGSQYRRDEWVDHFMIHAPGGWEDAETVRAARATLLTSLEAIDAAAARGQDVPVSEVLPDAGRWVASVRYILQLLASEDPERVSCKGFADYDDTGVNWPLLTGLGDLVERMAAPLPVRLGTPVTHVEQRAAGVRLRTAEGTLEARAAIVTVSTNMLLSGAIAFGAGPARDLLDLVGDAPCGAYEKVAIALRRTLVEDPRKIFVMVESETGASPLDFQIVRSDPPLMIAHLGGSLARDLARAGAAAMRDFALGRLDAAFGADIRNEVLGVATTGWIGNPWVRGGYSHARPGTGAQRHRMIAAETGSVAFAGEAFSPQWQATAHGAYQSGRDAAARVAEGLRAG